MRIPWWEGGKYDLINDLKKLYYKYGVFQSMSEKYYDKNKKYGWTFWSNTSGNPGVIWFVSQGEVFWPIVFESCDDVMNKEW